MSRTIGEAGATLPENAVHPGPQWQQQACEDFFSQMACSARKAGLSFLSRQQRGHSSAGRAPAWHAGGQRFDPAWLHQIRTLGRSHGGDRGSNPRGDAIHRKQRPRFCRVFFVGEAACPTGNEEEEKASTPTKSPVLFRARKFGYGAIAQLGERLHGMQEVSGSIPLGSTKSGH